MREIAIDHSTPTANVAGQELGKKARIGFIPVRAFSFPEHLLLLGQAYRLAPLAERCAKRIGGCLSEVVRITDGVVDRPHFVIFVSQLLGA